MSARIEVRVVMAAELHARAAARAARQALTFDAFTARALEREIAAGASTAATGEDAPSELVEIKEVARMLQLSVGTVLRRARKPGDPLRLAKSRLGKQKPMHFLRSKLQLAERGV